MIPVVISTYPGREQWLVDLQDDLPSSWQVHVVHGWELDAIRWGLDNLTADRFLHLQDSWRILKPDAIAQAIEDHRYSVAFTNDPVPFGCFTGVFERAELAKVELPDVEDKAHAIRLEVEWTRRYVAACVHPPFVLFPDVLHDWHGVPEWRHGRLNLVVGTAEVRKYKGTWEGQP